MTTFLRTDAPIEKVEELQRFDCAICKVIGQEDYPDASSWSDLYGKSFPFAQMTPTGAWVCSRGCLSQLMFDSATEHGKAILKRFEFALSELDEIGDEVRGTLEPWECDSRLDSRSIQDALAAVGHSTSRFHNIRAKETPAWIASNTDPQESLREAIRKAVWQLGSKVIDVALGEIRFEHSIIADSRTIEARFITPISTERAGKILGSTASIITALQAALNGGAE